MLTRFLFLSYFLFIILGLNVFITKVRRQRRRRNATGVRSKRYFPFLNTGIIIVLHIVRENSRVSRSRRKQSIVGSERTVHWYIWVDVCSHSPMNNVFAIRIQENVSWCLYTHTSLQTKTENNFFSVLIELKSKKKVFKIKLQKLAFLVEILVFSCWWCLLINVSLEYSRGSLYICCIIIIIIIIAGFFPGFKLYLTLTSETNASPREVNSLFSVWQQHKHKFRAEVFFEKDAKTKTLNWKLLNIQRLFGRDVTIPSAYETYHITGLKSWF